MDVDIAGPLLCCSRRGVVAGN